MVSSEINNVLLGIVFLAQLFLGLFSSTPEKSPLQDGDTFDFIVVGGGTSGCIIAARLSQSGKYTVLLIEAGGLPPPDLEIPARQASFFNSEFVKRYKTVPQRNAAVAQKGILNFARGNVLGGSSGINAMALNRGSPHDYNNWAKLTGDPSWKYESLLKYFKKFENYSGDYPSDQRGSDGPIAVSRPKYAPGLDEWLQAGRELGYKIAEPNGPQVISFTAMDFNQRRGRRVSSYKGYIEPMLQLPLSSSSSSFLTVSFQSRKTENLRIFLNTEVNRIIFEGNQAVGVKFTINSTIKGSARARKEIVVTAGVIESPALLMRSGVGPKSVLDSANIPAVKHLPVGKNLMDHVSATVTVVFGNRSAAFIPDRDLNPASWKMYNEIGDGPYGTTFSSNGQAFITSSIISPEEKELGWPDLHLLAQNSDLKSVLAAGLEVSDLKASEVPVQWSVYVSRPKSRGTITLDPMNIDSSPLLDFQYLSHADDMQVMIDGLKVFLKICEETAGLRRIGCRIPTDVLPACSHVKFRSDPYWKCYVTQLSSVGLHGAGTCKMGSGSEDPQAVVDSKLRVIGIENLRVCDASVMPGIPNSNIQAAVFAIGEKAADMILERWEEQSTSGKLLLDDSTTNSATLLRQLIALLK